MNLSREVLWNVLSYVGHKSFNKSRRVCRQWKQTIDSADFRAFYARFQADNFSNYTISMFDESVDDLAMPAKFVSMENFRNGFVTTSRSSQVFQWIKNDSPKELLDDEFRTETEKLCLSYSVHGNRNNWNMKPSNMVIPPSTYLDHFFAVQLDQYFPTSNHPVPRSLNPYDFRDMMEQRAKFDWELCKTQKYGFMIPLTEG